MPIPVLSLLHLYLCLCLLDPSLAFTTTSTTSTQQPRSLASPSLCRRHQSPLDAPSEGVAEAHPAVEAWPDRYVAAGGSPESKDAPRAISFAFDVHPATDRELEELDVLNWPTWTTADKPKWGVGNLVADKEMPYGELSYLVYGRLEIVPRSTGVPVVVAPGDLVTFPKGFVASWKVLEELTWHYYLY